MRMKRTSLLWVVAAAIPIAGCGQDAAEYGPTGTIDFEINRPELMDPVPAVEYTGSNEYVLEAQALHRTALQLHRNVVVRTCGPTDGVCHNQKEYPDLHSPANLLAALNAPCNVQPGDWSAVYDGCELPGDRIELGDSREVEIGWIDYVVGDEDYDEDNLPSLESPGLHIRLQTAINVGGDRGRVWETARFSGAVVDGGEIAQSTYGEYQTEWYLLESGTHLVGEVREWQVDRVTRVLDNDVEQGDMNRNGLFGAREATPLSMLKSGDPERSYLIGRLRGELSGQPIPGTRMPLANEPLTIPDMLGLFCFVEGLPDTLDGVYDLSSPINYQDCSWSADPEGLNLLGKGATWLGRVQPLLNANCGGCHGGEAPQGGFDLLSEGAYERLFEASTQAPAMPFITPGEPSQSYLWIKLTGGDGLLGQTMPLDTSLMPRPLPAGALADIETWIGSGAAAEE
jgi:hypothetical protein